MAFVNPTTGLSIKDVFPNMKNINLYFIVVEAGNLMKMKNNDELRILKVADKTGCINLSAWNDLSSCLNPGDICKLTNGYSVVFKTVLSLSISKQSEVTKVGEFCFLFSEVPDRSIPNPEYAVFERRQDTDAEGGGDGSEATGGGRYPSGPSPGVPHLGGASAGGPSSGTSTPPGSSTGPDSGVPSSNNIPNGSVTAGKRNNISSGNVRANLGGLDVDERLKSSVSPPSAVDGDQDFRREHNTIGGHEGMAKQPKLDNGNFKKSISSPALHPDFADSDFRHKPAMGAANLDPRLQLQQQVVGMVGNVSPSRDVDERRPPNQLQPSNAYTANNAHINQVVSLGSGGAQAQAGAPSDSDNSAMEPGELTSTAPSYQLGHFPPRVPSNSSAGVPFATYSPPHRMAARLPHSQSESFQWANNPNCPASSNPLRDTDGSNRDLSSFRHDSDQIHTKNGGDHGTRQFAMDRSRSRGRGDYSGSGSYSRSGGVASDPRLSSKVNHPGSGLNNNYHKTEGSYGNNQADTNSKGGTGARLSRPGFKSSIGASSKAQVDPRVGAGRPSFY